MLMVAKEDSRALFMICRVNGSHTALSSSHVTGGRSEVGLKTTHTGPNMSGT